MPHTESRIVACRHLQAGNEFVSPQSPRHYPPDLELEPQHLDIDLHLDLDAQEAGGTVTTTIRARRAGPRQLTLDAVDFLDLEVADPDGSELTWQYDGETITITWAEPFGADEERRVAVSYRLRQPADGLFFSRPTDAYPEQAWYAATDHETERARHWLPCVDQPTVRTTLDFHLRAEQRFTILANGALVGEDVHEDGTHTAHWRLSQPCPSYLVCFAIGDLVRADDAPFEGQDPVVPIAYFCSQDHDRATLQRSFGRTGEMLEWMTAKLDMAYPYPKYYQFALPGFGGAMENISLVSWSDRALLDEASFAEIGWFIDGVNLHEMAHSYFGDAVVIRDFSHAWLKESWATYMEQCWREDRDGQDEALYIYYDNAHSYFEEADQYYQRPIVTRRFKSSWQLYDRHLYPGGACRLHTLRAELGDDVFWAAVRDYLNHYNGQVVETDDFRRLLEQHSGRSLGRFFDQWFHAPGYPDIKVTFTYEAEEERGIFEIEQRQEDKDKGVPLFELHTAVAWTIAGETRRQAVKLDQTRHVITVPMAADPEMVRFDPDQQILHKLSLKAGDRRLRMQLRRAPDVVGRIQAAFELAKSGKRANVQAIVDAYADEPFWGVRQYLAKALVEAKSETAIAGLAQVVRQESHPRVLRFVFAAAANFRDESLRDALAQRLQDELPPYARRAAFQAMGAQRRRADWTLLRQGTEQTGYHGLAQGGAFLGLAATRRADATDILLEAAAYGAHSNRLRRDVVSALADIGQGLEKAVRERVRETLVDLLRDPWRDVRFAAARGLVQMKATEARPELEAFKQGLAHQHAVGIEKLIQRLRREQKVDGSAVKKQVEELEEKLRKLQEQLQDLQARVEADAQEEG